MISIRNIVWSHIFDSSQNSNRKNELIIFDSKIASKSRFEPWKNKIRIEKMHRFSIREMNTFVSVGPTFVKWTSDAWEKHFLQNLCEMKILRIPKWIVLCSNKETFLFPPPPNLWVPDCRKSSWKDIFNYKTIINQQNFQDFCDFTKFNLV